MFLERECVFRERTRRKKYTYLFRVGPGASNVVSRKGRGMLEEAAEWWAEN